jgi:hypothetical protein
MGKHSADKSYDGKSYDDLSRLKATKGSGEQSRTGEENVTGPDPALPKGITGHRLGRKSGR